MKTFIFAISNTDAQDDQGKENPVYPPMAD
jgi:hypothetical protein